ncbi:MAG TPA: hypothetical protein VJH24_00420 [Candidatus Bilamarchaeaceae archaeon]|nr:hypothetical protein [Candidatus Bilamarchaeaceae archaeon]
MKVSCAVCRGAIHGRHSGAKTHQGTSRRFPQLCMPCLREVVVESVRVQEGFKTLEEVHLYYRSYVQRMAK